MVAPACSDSLACRCFPDEVLSPPSFERYLLSAEFPQCPLFCWIEDGYEGTETINEPVAERYWSGVSLDKIKNSIKNKIVPWNDFVDPFCLIGASILWIVKKDGKLVQGECFFSHYFGRVKDLLETDTGITDGVIFRECRCRDPFDATEQAFQAALVAVLKTKKFKTLWEDYKGPWGTIARVNLVKDLWPAVRARMAKNKST